MNKRRAPASLATVLAVVGFSVAAIALPTEGSESPSMQRKRELIELIEERRRQALRLSGELAALRDHAARVTAAREAGTAAEIAEARRMDELSTAAGTVPVKGPGVVIRLNDSSRAPKRGDHAAAYKVQDADLQLVVNSLLVQGAEAISVNGSRVIATTAIRNAGGTVVINFRPVVPPYEVRAIGVDDEDAESTDLHEQFDEWSRLFGLEYEVEAKKHLLVPAFSGVSGVRSAQPVGP